MPTYTKTFDVAKPVNTDDANQLHTFISDDTKTALNERYSIEHVALNDATSGADNSDNAFAQGRHLPGKVSCLAKGTTTTINAITAMATGAIGEDTTLNKLVRYNSSTTIWEDVIPVSSFRVQKTAQNVSAGETTLTWTSEDWDEGADFDLPNDKYIAPYAGKFEFKLKIRLNSVPPTESVSAIIKVGSTTVSSNGAVNEGASSRSVDVMVSDQVLLSSASEVTAVVSSSTSGSLAVDTGASLTYFTGFFVRP